MSEMPKDIDEYRAGNQVYESSAHMNVIHEYSDTIVYYDDVMNKVFNAKLK